MTENEDVLRNIYREKASLFLTLSSTQMIKETGEIMTSSVLQEMSNSLRLRQMLTSSSNNHTTTNSLLIEEDETFKLLELQQKQRELFQRKIVLCQDKTPNHLEDVKLIKESCENLVDLKHSLMLNGDCWMEDGCVSCGELVGLSGQIRLRTSKRGKTRRRRASQKRLLEFVKRDQMAKHHPSSSSSNTTGHRAAVAAIVNQRIEQTKRIQFRNVNDGISKQRIVTTCTNCGTKSQCKGISVTSYLRKKQLADNERQKSPQTAIQSSQQSPKNYNHNILMNHSTSPIQTITNTTKDTSGLLGQRLNDSKKKKKKKKNNATKKSALSDFLSSLNS